MIENIEVYRGEKNLGEMLVIRTSTVRGYHRLDVRTDYRDKEGVYRPTRKGLCLSPDQWRQIIPEIQAAMIGIEGCV